MQEAVINYNACPGCGSVTIREALHATDHTVSGKDFAIWHCDQCSLRFTQQVPGPDAIQHYYKSDSYISHTNTKKV